MVEVFALLYLAVPGLMFALGWLKTGAAALVALPLAAGTARSIWEIRREYDGLPFFHRRDIRKLAWMLLLVIVWVIFGGVGGFVWQNPWDHKFRNAVFMDLVNNPWPVTKDGLGLCYYLGYWLPSSLVGKIGGLEAGYLFQIVWAILGICLAGLLIFRWLGRVSWKAFFLLIFFSGLDVVIFLLYSLRTASNPVYEFLAGLYQGTHIELLTEYFNSSSNTTLLFWLYNQIIPFWVGMMLLLTRKNNRFAVLVFGLMLFYCPFPCVALAPAMAYWMLLQGEKKITAAGLKCRFREAFSLCNVSVIPFVLAIAMYYTSNIATGKLALFLVTKEVMSRFAIYFLCEYGVYLVFLFRDNKKDPLLYLLAAVTVVCSFVAMGNSYDFAWRTCIPFAFYLMLLIMKKLEKMDWKRPLSVLLVLVLCMGAITPATEIIRTVRGEWSVLQGEAHPRSDTLPSVFQQEDNECYENFIGDLNSPFFRYLAAVDREETEGDGES